MGIGIDRLPGWFSATVSPRERGRPRESSRPVATDSAAKDSAATDSAANQDAAAGKEAAPLKPSPLLEAASVEMREHLKTMRLLAVKYHLSDDARVAKPLQSEWRKMLADGHKIHQKMIDAAVADFKADPTLDSEAGQFLTQLTGRNADLDRFDGMLDLVKLLHEHGQSGKSFTLCFGLTAGANNEFAMARPFLEEAAKNLADSMQELSREKKIPQDEREKIGKKITETYELVMDLYQTEVYEKLWQEELKAREADAAGEPLPRVLLETTKGDIEVELFENQYPNTVANFVSLCEEGFFDNLPFHRVIGHFMAQGGDPQRDGTGGPNYSIRTELNGKSDRGFFRGTLGMALSNLPDSGGSQFFICYLPRVNLNNKFVAFGRVINA